MIFLTFKDVKYDTWEETKINLYSVIQAEYRRHIVLLESDRIINIDKQYIEKMLTGTLDEALWAGTLANLSLFLDLNYGVAPVILIDEYDTPIQQGYMKGFYGDVITFMRNFLSGGLKDNRHVSMAFMTGILRVAKESIFSGLNNLNVNSVLENRYSEYFGFTENEVAQLLNDFGQEDKLPEVRKWYDGYQFGNSEIYNPWSVLSYVDSDFFPRTFWQSTGSNEIVGEIVKESSSETLQDLRRLLCGEIVEAYIDTSVVYPEIKRNPSSIYSFLLMAGYLTVRGGQPLHDGNSICRICIPNREIVILYEKEILDKLETVVSTSTAITLQQALLTGNMKKFQEELQEFIMSAVSYHDTSVESFYHGFLLGMCAVMNQYYELSSNRESGVGRYDIQLKPKNKKYPGFLIEIKAVSKEFEDDLETERALEDLAQSGLEQIKQKQYISELKQYGCERIVQMGVAFYKKKCKVISEETP